MIGGIGSVMRAKEARGLACVPRRKTREAKDGAHVCTRTGAEGGEIEREQGIEALGIGLAITGVEAKAGDGQGTSENTPASRNDDRGRRWFASILNSCAPIMEGHVRIHSGFNGRSTRKAGIVPYSER